MAPMIKKICLSVLDVCFNVFSASCQKIEAKQKRDSTLIPVILNSKFKVYKSLKSVDSLFLKFINRKNHGFCIADVKENFDPSENNELGLCPRRLVFYATSINKNTRILVYETSYGAGTRLVHTALIFSIENNCINHFAIMDLTRKPTTLKKMKTLIKKKLYALISPVNT